MESDIEEAITYRLIYPTEALSHVAKRFNVKRETLQYRLSTAFKGKAR
jgi:hypothetical protein